MVCDSCLTAAYDEGASGRDMAVQVCTNLGLDIPDHCCLTTEEEQEEECECECRRG